MIKFIDETDIKAKKLLIRVDYNVTLEDGKVVDDFRIIKSLPTLKYALERNAAVILCSHLGRPGGEKTAELSLQPIADRLSELLQQDVAMAPDCIGFEVKRLVDQLGQGQVLMLENLRFHPEEKDNDPEFCKQLADLADIYVNDAFAVAHRTHASVAGVPKNIEVCCAGLLMKKELEFFKDNLSDPDKPYIAILGGIKVSTKLKLLKKLLDNADQIIIGGGMAHTFLAARGHSLGTSLLEEDLIKDAKEILEASREKGVKLHLPVDVVLGNAPDCYKDYGTKDVKEIPADKMALDIGPESVRLFSDVLKSAATIVWNGPMGAFENPLFRKGSSEIAGAVTDVSGALTVAGGGDTISMLKETKYMDNLDFVSTGGGSFLQLLTGEELPALYALEIDKNEK
ncbi:MAG: phosphoglycerate kinase [Desulfobacterales bacterium]|nr:phosphoglycerate kinase [Desulfobacterales bacterium]